MDYNYIPKYIRQSETKRSKDVITATRWNELFNLLIEQGDYTAEELGNILNYFTGVITDLAGNLQTALDGKLDTLSTDPAIRGAFVKVGEGGQAVYDKTSYVSLYTLMSNYRTASAQNAIDNNLQEQIDAIVSSSDVKDVVGTYEALLAYDTSTLGNKDIVKVLSDSLHDNARSYFRWIITNAVGSWWYIGSEAESYTKAESDILLARKLNKNLGAANAGKVLVVNERGEIDSAELSPTIPEAPIDGKQYARQNGAWAEIIGGGTGIDGTKWYTGIDYPANAQVGDLWLYTGRNTAHPDGYALGDVSQYDGTNWTIVSNIRGATGQNGADGADGADGTDGNVIIVNSTLPSTADRNEGDIFINKTTFDVYRYKGGSVEDWVLVGNIKGASGTNGHTPIKGTDYWTAADKQGIVDDVLAALPTWQGGSY